MSSTSKSEAAKRFAPILEKETARTRDMQWHEQRFAPTLERQTEKTRNTEWLRYGTRLEQITTLITGFELSDEEADELKAKMSEETSQQLN
ncbi:unnamed protein product [Arabis nemorensis]|uniref:Uncharacterized protein n=1 Tax=Arabis nemorensis TaxID=586526 RepID=A0A565C899_9BRAS|nr:unnamed protein product [Arabis nemorensis]